MSSGRPMLPLIPFILLTQAVTIQAQDHVEVDPRPVVEIGSSATDPDDQLFLVGRVLRSGDGRFLVMESSTNRIRVYAPSGRFMQDLGGRGEGPGEFNDIIDMTLSGQQLLVLERDGSVTHLDLDGTMVDSWRLRLGGLVGEAFNPVPSGILPDGRAMIRANERVFGRPDGDYVQQAGFIARNREGVADTVTWVSSHRVQSVNGLPQAYQPLVMAGWAAGAGALWVGSPLTARFIKSGSAVEIRLQVSDRPPTDWEMDRFLEQYIDRGRTANDRRVITEWVEMSPRAENLPAYRHFIVDSLGRIWVEVWPDSLSQTVWEVFDADGHPLARVRLSDELRLEGAGTDWICGVWRDPRGVEIVRLYRLAPLPDGHDRVLHR